MDCVDSSFSPDQFLADFLDSNNQNDDIEFLYGKIPPKSIALQDSQKLIY